MSQYQSLSDFVDSSLMPLNYADEIEQMHPGWVVKQLIHWSGWIDARLAKRYATPFDAASPPIVVTEWLTRLVTHRCYLKRGVDPTDAQLVDVKADAESARAEITEAADAKDGRFELPLRADLPGTDGVSRGTALSYTEVSPYTWSELQRDAADFEGWGLR